jgi:hypothetical protein
MHNADEGPLINCFPDGTLTQEGQPCHNRYSVKERITACMNSDGKERRASITVRK